MELLENILNTLGFICQNTSPSKLPLNPEVYGQLKSKFPESELSQFLNGFPLIIAFHPGAQPELAGVLFFLEESNRFIEGTKATSLRLVQVKFTKEAGATFAQGRNLASGSGFSGLAQLLEELTGIEFSPAVLGALQKQGFLI